MLPSMGIEPRPLMTFDSKSNPILSELSWHLLLRQRLKDSYIVMFYLLKLNPLNSSKSKNQVVYEQNLIIS